MATAVNHTEESFEKVVREQQAEILYLKEQLAWLKRQIFGKKSERVVDTPSEQLLLEGFENVPQQKDETQTIATHKRKNERLPAKIPSNCPMIFP